MKYMPAIIPVAVLLIAYGAMSFANWNANPGTWGTADRFMAMFVGCTIAICAICATGYYIESRKSDY